MADEEADDESRRNKKRVGGRRFLLIFAILLVLLLAAGGAAVYFLGGVGRTMNAIMGEFSRESIEGAEIPGTFFQLEEMLVNLRTTPGLRRSFLKVKITLDLAPETDFEYISARQPKLVDVFSVFLRELRSEDLEGSQGVYRLRVELTKRANEVLRPYEVREVLFEQLTVQ